MIRIALRILLFLFLVFNLVILILCSLTGINIYKKYGRQIIIGISVFAALVIAFYLALALLGVES